MNTKFWTEIDCLKSWATKFWSFMYRPVYVVSDYIRILDTYLQAYLSKIQKGKVINL